MSLTLNVMYTEEADAWTWKSRPEKLAMYEAEACTTTPTRDLRPRNKMVNPLTPKRELAMYKAEACTTTPTRDLRPKKLVYAATLGK